MMTLSLFAMTVVDFLLFGLLAELVVRAGSSRGAGHLGPLAQEGRG